MVLRTRVFSVVGDERAGDGERHAAGVADVRLLSRVAPLVVHQRAGLGEAFSTVVTLVRLLATVGPGEGTYSRFVTGYEGRQTVLYRDT